MFSYFHDLRRRGNARHIADVIWLTDVCNSHSWSMDALLSTVGHAAARVLFISDTTSSACDRVGTGAFCGSLEFWQHLVPRSQCLAASSVGVVAWIPGHCIENGDSMVVDTQTPLIRVNTSVFQASEQPQTQRHLAPLFVSRCEDDGALLNAHQSEQTRLSTMNRSTTIAARSSGSSSTSDQGVGAGNPRPFLVIVAGVNNEKFIFQQVAQSLVLV
jgi:hypothetical protein